MEKNGCLCYICECKDRWMQTELKDMERVECCGLIIRLKMTSISESGRLANVFNLLGMNSEYKKRGWMLTNAVRGFHGKSNGFQMNLSYLSH